MDGNAKGERERIWRGHLAARQKSGLSQAAYCRQHGLTQNDFSWWKREIARRDAQTAVPAASFVPVRVTGMQATGYPFELELRGGRIHLTDSAYVAWGFYLYDCMNPPVVESSAELNVSGRVLRETHCKISSVSASSSGILEFARADTVLPLLPPDPIPTGNSLKVAPSTSTGTIKQDAPLDKSKPRSIMQLADGRNADAFFGSLSYATLVPAPLTITVKSTAATGPKMPLALANYALKFGAQLPSRKFVPLEKYSRYMLKIEGLDAGEYDVSCDGKPIGRATDKELAAGVNLNTLLLDSKNPAPWGELVKALWLGKRLDEIGKTQWKFRVEKK